MAEKRHGIIENLEVDQYLEAQGYMKYDNTINIEIWCITSAGKWTRVVRWRMSANGDALSYAIRETGAAWGGHGSDTWDAPACEPAATCGQACA